MCLRAVDKVVGYSPGQLQQEKEALDDISMELELADEDQPIMYVSTPLRLTELVLTLAGLPATG